MKSWSRVPDTGRTRRGHFLHLGLNDLQVRLREGGVVEVRVTDGDGRPIPGTFLSHQPIGSRATTGSSAPTDATGRLVLRDLPLGDLLLTAMANGYESFEESVSVQPGRQSWSAVLEKKDPGTRVSGVLLGEGRRLAQEPLLFTSPGASSAIASTSRDGRVRGRAASGLVDGPARRWGLGPTSGTTTDRGGRHADPRRAGGDPRLHGRRSLGGSQCRGAHSRRGGGRGKGSRGPAWAHRPPVRRVHGGRSATRNLGSTVAG